MQYQWLNVNHETEQYQLLLVGKSPTNNSLLWYFVRLWHAVINEDNTSDTVSGIAQWLVRLTQDQKILGLGPSLSENPHIIPASNSSNKPQALKNFH